MKEKYAPAAIALSLIAIAVTLRILPHPANFAPVGAVSIFGGAILPKRMSVLVPLLAMMISDAVIGFYSLMPLIWACYLIIALASSHWLRPVKLRRGIGLTLGASVFFFRRDQFWRLGYQWHVCPHLVWTNELLRIGCPVLPQYAAQWLRGLHRLAI